MADMKAYFRQQFSVDILQRQSAVADHFPGIFQAHGPQPEAVFPVTVHIAFDP